MKIKEDNFIEGLKNKDERALDYVIDNYGHILKAIVNKHMYLLEDYKDQCINDCLLAVWENIDSFDPSRSSFKNWLGGIGKYKSIDYIRKYSRDRENTSLADLEIPIEGSLAKDLLEEEALEEIDRLLGQLKPRDQLLFKELFIEERDLDLVAEDLGMARENVYNRVSRARKKLRKLFVGGDYFE